MPALVLFGRRWCLAADDLPLPSLVGALWHLGVLTLSSVDLAFVREQLEASCPYRKRHTAYLSAHLACSVINCVLHTWTFFESARGSILQLQRRHCVPPLVLAVILLYCFTIGDNVYGTRLVFVDQQSTQQCIILPGPLHLNHFALMKAIVVATWVSLFVGFLAFVITLNVFSDNHPASSSCLICFKLNRVLCYCCLWRSYGQQQGKDKAGNSSIDGYGNKHIRSSRRSSSPMYVVANIFTHIFGRFDMTLTDYIATLTLVGSRHSHSKPALTYSNAKPPGWLLEKEESPRVAPCVLTIEAPGGVGVVLQPPAVVGLAASSGRSNNGSNRLPHANKATLQPKVMDTPAGLQPSTGVPPLVPRHIALQVLSGAPAVTTTTSSTDTVTLMFPPTTCDSTSMATAAATATAGSNATPAATASLASGPGPTAGNVTAAGAAVPLIANGADKGPAAATDLTPLASGLPPPEEEEEEGTRGPPAGGAGVVPAAGFGGAHDFSCLVRQWDAADYAQPNASLEVMEEALHYMRFAMAVYGWKMYLWMNRASVTSCCRLCVGRDCGCCRQCSYFIRALGPDYGPSEGCCSAAKLLEREAITQIAGVPDDDIIYVCYDNRIGGLLPYYIAVDRKRRSVVVGVRGSLSLSDVVTDLLCEPVEYDVPGVSSTDASGRRVLWAHRGILESTLAILRDIQQQGVLRAAVATPWPQRQQQQGAGGGGGGGSRSRVEAEAGAEVLRGLPSDRAQAVAARLRGTCTGFRVVVTGHSLGAGVAGLLGPLLRPHFPNLRCWAFAPPGGLMSPKAAQLTHGMCISLTHAKDIIPRLSISTMEGLLEDLLGVAVYSRVPKLTVMGRLVLMRQRLPLERLFHAPDDDLKRELQRVLDEYSSRRLGRAARVRVDAQFDGARDFVPPGHMLYLERRRGWRPLPVQPPPPSGPGSKTRSPLCCSFCGARPQQQQQQLGDEGTAPVAQYVCRWIHVGDLMAAGLVVSRSMFADHLPDVTIDALQQALAQMRHGSGAQRSGGNGFSSQMSSSGRRGGGDLSNSGGSSSKPASGAPAVVPSAALAPAPTPASALPDLRAGGANTEEDSPV